MIANPTSRLPRLLAVLSGINPSNLMDVVKPLLALEKRGVLRTRITLEPYFTPDMLAGVDLVVFCRNLEPRYAHILAAVQARRIPFIYDLDDDLFETPPDTEDGAFYAQPDRQRQLQRYLQSAALVRVYSHPLVERSAQYNANIARVKPPLDLDRLRPRLSPSEPVRLVYATSRHEDHLFGVFLPALQTILARYPGRVEMTFWGFQPGVLEGQPGVHKRPFDENYDRFLTRFAHAGFHIGLAPLLDDRFHRSKTNNKFREYAACGIAGVYSNVSIYNECVTNGETGLLVENRAAAWTAALARLVEDRGLRERMGRAARQYVEQHYPAEEFLGVWQAQIESLVDQRAGRIAPGVWQPEEQRQAGPAAEDALPTHAGGPGAAERASEDALPTRSGGPGAIGQASESAAPIPGVWRSKMRRAVELLRAGDLRRMLFNLRAHAKGLWWQFKINRLKRL